nr:unnamed protein product [Callosobruchus chinensis]
MPAVSVVLFVLLLPPFAHSASYPDLSHAEDVQLVYPQVTETRRRRNAKTDQRDELTRVVKLGDWFVELNLSDESVVSPELRTEWVRDDGTSQLSTPIGHSSCRYYTGSLKGLEGRSRAAVTLCDGGKIITAYLDVAGVSHFLEPINETSGAHALYTSKGNSLRPKRNSAYSDFYMPEAPTTRQWLFNLTGDTIDIEDDGISAQDEQIPSGLDFEENRDNTTSNVTQEGLDGFWWNIGVDDDGYVLDSSWTIQSNAHSRKHSGPVLPPRWLEIAVAVDHTVIAFHGKDKVEQYVLSLLNIVSAIYQDPTLQANIHLVVTRLIFYEHKKHGTVRSGHAKKSLENVNKWNRRLHEQLAPGEPRHDAAVWLTKANIGGPSGYAPVAGVCNPKRSCALNRDEGLTSAFIIAHETAHMLGLSHDGDKKHGNDCSDEAVDGSIMAPMVSATFNKFSWSECSKKEFRKNAKKWSCLSNPPSFESGGIILNSTLQASFTMDEQCRMEFGEGYYMCRAFEIIEPCSHLWCGHKDTPTVCRTKKGPPLEGTECGFGKWCVNGYCVDVSTGDNDEEASTGEHRRPRARIPIVLNPQDGGWAPWQEWGTCSRPCGIGVQFRIRMCDNPPPSYGGKNCEGEQEEWRTCNVDPCTDALVDLRAQQCKQLPQAFHLDGKPEDNFTWLPYESEDDSKKCKLTCINAEKKELYITEENLYEGTPCSYENSDSICVRGKCYQVGCDGQVNSKLLRDRCGVCGGNNTDCSEIDLSSSRKLKREASRISVLPRMARQIKVELNVSAPNEDRPAVALVLKKRGKKEYTVAVPNTVVHTKILEGVKFFYRKDNNSHSIWAKGPLFAELVILVVVTQRELQTGISVDYNTKFSIQKSYLEPSKRFIWITGGWGPCSASCGVGIAKKL